MRTTANQTARPAWPPPNSVKALAVGACVGAALTSAALLVAGLGGAPLEHLGSALSGGLVLMLVAFTASLPIWALGLIMIGMPGWRILWTLGWRSRGAGAAFGGAATFFASSVLITGLGLRAAGDPRPFLIVTGVLGLSGAVAGWMVVVVSEDAGRAAR